MKTFVSIAIFLSLALMPALLHAQVHVNNVKDVLVQDTSFYPVYKGAFNVGNITTNRDFVVVNVSSKITNDVLPHNRVTLNFVNHSLSPNIESNTGVQNIINSEMRSYSNGVVNFMKEDDFGMGTPSKECVGVVNRSDQFFNDYSGFKNDLQNNSAGKIRGFHNYVNMVSSSYDMQPFYGLYNDIYIKGEENMYGVYNYLFIPDTSASSNDIFGEYTYIPDGGSGTHYGVYADVPGDDHYAAYFSGNVTIVNGDFNDYSDARLKENIEDFTGALELVKEVKVRTFNRKSDPAQSGEKRLHYGFIAQELREVIPDIVKEHPSMKDPVVTERIDEVDDVGFTANADGSLEAMDIKERKVLRSVTHERGQDFLGVNYIEVIPILLQAIKEQQAIIEALQTKNEDQDQLISDLAKRIDALEKR